MLKQHKYMINIKTNFEIFKQYYKQYNKQIFDFYVINF